MWKRVLAGQLLLIVCFIFYLIWWARGFRPGVQADRVKGFNGALLLITAVAGLSGMALSMTGAMPRINPLWILTGGIAAYVVLLIVTRFLFRRVVTSELFLIVVWTMLEVWVISAGMLKGPRFGIMVGIIALAFIVSMVCYVAYYRMEEMKAFYVAMVPLAAGIVSTLALVLMAV